jgi:hypothetical protein
MRTIVACRALLYLALAWPMLAQAQSEPTTDSPAYLGSFPTPQRVRADILVNADGATPEEIEGRVEGRLETLANALRHSWASGYVNRETGLPIPGIESAPVAAKQLHGMYSREIDAITRNANQTYPTCGFITRLLRLTGITEACARLGYQIARDKSNGTYTDNVQASAQIAELYFPPDLRELFIETSGGDGRYMSRHQVSVGGQQRHAQREYDQSRTPEGRTRALAATSSAFALASLVVLGIGVLFFVKGIRLHKRLERYEFEHRTPGGVVQFADYDASLRHRREKWKKDLMIRIATMALVIGTLGLTMTGSAFFIELGRIAS